MASISKFIESMHTWCCSMDMHYSQQNRQNFQYGGSADCSSTVIHCLQEAGFDTGSASYTGNMSHELCANGWRRYVNNGIPKAGDILLDDTSDLYEQHVGIWDGEHVVEFGGDPHYGYITCHGYYDHPWSCYLRYEREDEMVDEKLDTIIDILNDTTDPTGRTDGVTMRTHIKYLAGRIVDIDNKLDKLIKMMEKNDA